MRSQKQKENVLKCRRSVVRYQTAAPVSRLGRVKILNPIMLNVLGYARSGYAVLPLFEPMRDGSCACGDPNCGRIGKHPRTRHGVGDATSDLKTIEDWWTRWPNANIGIATGEPSDINVVDLDSEDAVTAFLELCQAQSLPSRATVKTARGYHVFYRRDGLAIGNSAGKVAPGIDVRGDGGYVVAHGSQHASGQMYRLVGWSASHRIMVPAETPDWLAALSNQARSTPRVSESAKGPAYCAKALQDEIAKLRTAQEHHRNDALNRGAFKLGQLCAGGVLNETAVVDALKHAALVIGLDPKEIDATIRSGLSAGLKNPRSVAYDVAASEDPSKATSAEGETSCEPAPADDVHAESLAPLGLTEADNARRIAARHQTELLYTAGGGWYVFNGRFWEQDHKRKAILLAEETARKIANEAPFCVERKERLKFSQQSLSKGALSRALDLAGSHLAKADNELDADLWKLSVANGTVELKTGLLQPHAYSDYITKMVDVPFDPGALCPLFERFLSESLAADTELIEYVQRCVGMSLTGDISEQIFFLLFGSGGTGKSTFLTVVRDMLGSYAQHSAMDLWLEKTQQESIPVGLARLRGARMVTAIEVNQGKRLDEAKIKAVTGGDPIVARELYQNLLQFQPQCTLWFAFNDLPGARQTSDAFWRRARAITFDGKVDEGRKDPDLLQKLKAEYAGILRWAVEGCVKWHADGLKTPSAVTQATAAWNKKVDHFDAFVRDRIIRDKGNDTRSSFVFDAYTTWCERRGEEALNVKAFKARMEDDGFKQKKHRDATRWQHIKLRAEE